eukprot:gene46442-57913_t
MAVTSDSPKTFGATTGFETETVRVWSKQIPDSATGTWSYRTHDPRMPDKLCIRVDLTIYDRGDDDSLPALKPVDKQHSMPHPWKLAKHSLSALNGAFVVNALPLLSMGTDISKGLFDASTSDLVLVAKDGEEICVHKLIVSLRSDVLKDMIQSQDQESSIANKSVESSQLSGDDPQAFEFVETKPVADHKQVLSFPETDF